MGRSLIANGNIDDQPSGSNVEKLIWDYQIQELAQQFTEKCDANKRPSFDNDKLNNLSFSFEADFNQFLFGHNIAFIHNQNMTAIQILYQLQSFINEWFEQHNDYYFNDPISDQISNYLNCVVQQDILVAGMQNVPFYDVIH